MAKKIAVGSKVRDPQGNTGKVTRLYREGGYAMAEVQYAETWTDDNRQDWFVEDLRAI